MPEREGQTQFIVECRDVSRVYTSRRSQRRAIDGVSFELGSGSFVALLGPNGAGKSTLLRCLATADTPDSGLIRVLGQDTGTPTGRRAIRSQIGVVFQSVSLDPLLTVRENLLLHAALQGADAGGAREQVARVADRFELVDRLDDRVGSLSGGLARRTDLARAMLHSPVLLLLDEPTVGLDHASRQSFMDQLVAFAESPDQTRPTVVLSTHHMDEADRADRAMLMHQGKIIADGAPNELRARAGAWILECEGTQDWDRLAEFIRAKGFQPTRTHRGALRTALDENESEPLLSIVAKLVDQGVSVSVGPPTLGDAYLQLTGESLQDSTPGQHATPSKHRRRAE